MNLKSIVEECLAAKLSPEQRPELSILNEKYAGFMRQNGWKRKRDADRVLCARIFGEEASESAQQKLRYWRSGKHVPNDRGTAVRLGMALEMTNEEIRELMLGWMDRVDECFAENQMTDLQYQERISCMQELVHEYVIKICIRNQDRYLRPETAEHELRHYYYQDARQLVNGAERSKTGKPTHFQSIYYNSEFQRNIHLIGEIPRRTMIRHLMIMGMPYISREVISGYLQQFGYLPLKAEHTTVQGDALDLLVLRFLEYYETACRKRTPEECTGWLKENLLELDRILAEKGCESLRFMKFKSLN